MYFRLFASFALLALSANPASAEIHTGRGTLYWDFSAGAEGPGYDIALYVTIMGPYSIVAEPPGGILALNDPYESLLEAPTNRKTYMQEIPFESAMIPTMGDHVVIVRTREGHYAKFKFTWAGQPWPDRGHFDIDYTYQDDGSPRFYDSPVANHTSTWGRIKAMYDR